MSRIERIRFWKTLRPLRTLFRTSLGSKSVATSVLVEVTLAGGAMGVGEVPTSFVLPHETPDAIKAVLADTRRLLAGAPVTDWPAVKAGLQRRFGEFHMTLSGLEVALFRAELADMGESELAYWSAQSASVETDITVAFIPDPQDLCRWMKRAAKIGFRHYKVKVTGDVEADIAFVKAVREHLERLTGGYVIRLDGNQGYKAGSYRRMLDELRRAKIDIELFEQPLPADDFAGLRKIAGCSPVPVILDETVFDAEACRRVIDERLGDGVNIKIAKSGIAESAAILKCARAGGLKLMIGCMTETMVGLSAGIYMAAGTAAFDYVDLDAAHLLFGARRFGDIEIAGRRYLIDGHAPARTEGER